MRKIIAASVVGLALIAGQALASNQAAESLRVGDRVGGALQAHEDFGFGSWFASGGFFGGAGVVGSVITTIIAVAVVVPVVDAVVDDGEDSPSA